MAVLDMTYGFWNKIRTKENIKMKQSNQDDDERNQLFFFLVSSIRFYLYIYRYWLVDEQQFRVPDWKLHKQIQGGHLKSFMSCAHCSQRKERIDAAFLCKRLKYWLVREIGCVIVFRMMMNVRVPHWPATERIESRNSFFSSIFPADGII